MKLLIAGDSYSDVKYGDNWVKRFPDAECVARIGNSNYDIWQSIKDRTWNLLVVNLSHPNRLNRASIENKDAGRQRKFLEEFPATQKKLHDLSIRFAEQILDLPNVICWSPFPHYESWKIVHSIILPEEDDMWMSNPKDYRPDPIVGCHYTQKGNEIVYEKISGWILDWVNKK
tara:strand:- start:215 stop:733 length:519 start_codon:yes stop_codon:yes gene_type:complete